MLEYVDAAIRFVQDHEEAAMFIGAGVLVLLYGLSTGNWIVTGSGSLPILYGIYEWRRGVIESGSSRRGGGSRGRGR